MTDSDKTALAQAFLKNEDAAFAKGKQSRFWTMNHHHIAPQAAQLAALLAPEDRTAFYFHLMRVTGSVPLVAEQDMELLLAAYRRLIPLLDRTDIWSLARRHPMLYVFGFDEKGSLASGVTDNRKALAERLKALKQIDKYVNLPGQRAKKANFLPFAGEAPRLLETLRHLGYRHDRRYGDDLYDLINLTFWGMLLLILLNETTRAELLRDMLDGDYDLPRKDECLEILHLTVEAVLPDSTADDTEFRTLAARLAAIHNQRRDSSEAAALVQNLQLPFADDERWDIIVTVPQAGSTGSPLLAPNVSLYIRPDPDEPWRIQMDHSEQGTFVETSQEIIRNDPKIEGLGKGNLLRFPAWVQTIGQKHGLIFDLPRADIRVGRKRSAAKLVAQWLVS